MGTIKFGILFSIALSLIGCTTQRKFIKEMEVNNSKLLNEPLFEIEGTYIIKDSTPKSSLNYMLDIEGKASDASPLGTTFTISKIGENSISIESTMNGIKEYSQFSVRDNGKLIKFKPKIGGKFYVILNVLGYTNYRIGYLNNDKLVISMKHNSIAFLGFFPIMSEGVEYQFTYDRIN